MSFLVALTLYAHSAKIGRKINQNLEGLEKSWRITVFAELIVILASLNMNKAVKAAKKLKARFFGASANYTNVMLIKSKTIAESAINFLVTN